MMRFPSAATTRTTLATHPSTPPPSSRLRRAWRLDRSGRLADGAGDRDRSKSRERSPPGQASKSQLEPDRKNAEGATAENGPKLFCAICGERGHRFKACHHRIPDSEIPKGGCPICGDVSHRMVLCPRRKIDPDLVCPICKKKGHERRNCPDKPPEDHSKTWCFICGERGHLRVNCPKKLPDEKAGRGCCICGSDKPHPVLSERKPDPEQEVKDHERAKKRERNSSRDRGREARGVRVRPSRPPGRLDRYRRRLRRPRT